MCIWERRPEPYRYVATVPLLPIILVRTRPGLTMDTQTKTKADDIPGWFLAIFGRLARTTTTPRIMDRAALPAYFDLLREFPADVVIEAASRCATAKPFFPTCAEWIAAIRAIDTGRRTVGDCVACAGRGLIAVRYHDGSPFDVAICDCKAGRWWRDVGELVVRSALHLEDPANRVAYVEDFAGEDV